MTKKTFTVTFLFHRDGGEGFPLGYKQVIRMNISQDAISEYGELTNARHEELPYHIVNAFADDNNFIMFNISEIWNANPVLQALQSLKRYEEMNVNFPMIYTNEGLATARAEYEALCLEAA